MHKKNRMINELIPADDLHWDDEEKKHVVISKEDQDRLFRACFGCGLEEDDVIKVLRHYSYFKTSELLFKHFLEGNIGIYELSKSGAPIFDKIRNTSHVLKVFYRPLSVELPDSLEWKEDELPIEEINHLGITAGVVCSSQSRDTIPFDKIFKTIFHWCYQNSFNLWEENPDNEDTWSSYRDDETLKRIKQKCWRLPIVEQHEDGSIYLEVELGTWFEFIEEQND